MAVIDRERNITIGGIPLIISRQKFPNRNPGRPNIAHSRAAKNPIDAEPFTEVIPFGPDGIGYDLVPGDGNQYTLDTDAERQWGELAPGLLHAAVGLALDNPVTVLEETFPTTGMLGPTSSGTQADDNTGSIGTLTWASPSNAASSNDTYTTITTSGTNQTSHYLKLTNFGFAIPTGESVLGVIVRVEGKCSAGQVKINARIVIGGTTQTGTTRSEVFGAQSDIYLYFGGHNDIFGQASISEAQGEASTFGVSIYTSENDTSGAVISIDHVTITIIYGSNTDQKLLYAGSGAVMTKMDYQCSGTTVTWNTRETKTFSHATAPVITDIKRIKENSPGDAKMLIGFGASAPLAQINGITPASTDTYQTQSTDPAYAGKFALAPADDPTTTAVWKSTGSDEQNAGAFSRLQYATRSRWPRDLTNQGSWLPDTPHAPFVGDPGSDINAMSEWQTDLAVAKAEGLYAWGRNGSTNYLSFREYRSELNGRGLVVWHQSLFCQTIDDVKDYAQGDLPVGLSALLSNLSPIQGRPTALAAFGKYLFAMYYDGTDSYLVKFTKGRGGSNPYSIHGMTKIASYQSQVMQVIVDENDVSLLVYAAPSATPSKHDLRYCVLSPIQSRLYADGGTFFSKFVGSMEKRTTIQSVSAYGVGLDANNTWQAAVSVDGGAFANVGAALNTNGLTTRDATAGTVGTLIQFRWTVDRNTTADQPRLRGIPGENGISGFVVKGLRMEAIDRFEVNIDLADNLTTNYGGRTLDTPELLYSTLVAFMGTNVNIVWPYYFGDSLTHTVLVNEVGFIGANQDAAQVEGERTVRIRFSDPV